MRACEGCIDPECGDPHLHYTYEGKEILSCKKIEGNKLLYIDTESWRNTSMDIDETLADRGKKYGEFVHHATVSQILKETLQCQPAWKQLAYDQREALEMILHKIARIINGDPDYHDSWYDIIGYAKLVADRLEKK